MRHCKLLYIFILFSVLLLGKNPAVAQQHYSSKYGPNDTLLVPIYVYNGDTLPMRTLEMVWVTAKMPAGMRKRLEEWTKLRNAVYVTYPYAKKAGAIMNDMNQKMAKMATESEKKSYIKTREKELKKEFADPLTNLSVYQGKILMK